MSKVINLNEWRQQKDGAETQGPIPGVIVWLHCPTCQTMEYTELQMEGGRVHKCGTMVQEAEVPIDVRAEYTISLRNLDILEQLPDPESGGKLKLLNKWLGASGAILKQIKLSEIEYQRRLRLMASGEITPYPDDWTAEKNGIAYTKIQPTRILITSARQAEQHFPSKK